MYVCHVYLAITPRGKLRGAGVSALVFEKKYYTHEYESVKKVQKRPTLTHTHEQAAIHDPTRLALNYSHTEQVQHT